ncbi:hypothetical protein GCM10011247_40510 [Pseudomonas plecoglossicida]|nr:hypothetical protein GCM10011247_40510 [Pseudomonas plecoglossicida]
MYGRRDVLRASAALGLLAVSPWLHAATANELLSRKVPSTGESLPVIGAGTSGSFEVAPDSAQYQQLKAVLKAFFDGGGKVIDTSPNYGGADQLFGQRPARCAGSVALVPGQGRGGAGQPGLR